MIKTYIRLSSYYHILIAKAESEKPILNRVRKYNINIMNNLFIGKWKDENGSTIAVTGSKDLITVKYDNGRGPFTGYEAKLISPIISVDFSDKTPYSGVLSSNGSKIYWGNDTVWLKD